MHDLTPEKKHLGIRTILVQDSGMLGQALLPAEDLDQDLVPPKTPFLQV